MEATLGVIIGVLLILGHSIKREKDARRKRETLTARAIDNLDKRLEELEKCSK